MIIETYGPEETKELGEKIGRQARPGQIYTLTGDLGVGKTVFTQGLARGLGIKEPVSSPHVYHCGRSMKKDDCRCTTSMYTASAMWKKWRRSDMTTISLETASA